MRNTALLVMLLVLAPGVVNAVEAQAPDPQLRKVLKEAIKEAPSFYDRFDAEVWLMDMSNRLAAKIPDTGKRLRLLKMIHQEATHAHLPPELVLAVIDVESDFDRFAVSSAGAQGLMQVMPFWLKEIGRPDDNLFHVRTNLRLGCTILGYYLHKEHGNIRAALELYNGTTRRSYSDRVFTALSEKWYRQ